jgi:DNA-binding NarL/FixJ family response regulator
MKILIVDDHELITGGLSLLLSAMPEVSECRSAGSVRQARRVLGGFDPEVVLLDMALPDGSGLQLLDELRVSQPGCRVMLVSGRFSPAQLAHLMTVDVDGLFSKSDGAAQLQEAIAALCAGDKFYSAEVRQMLGRFDNEQDFTPRQLEILQLVDAGLTNKEIASRTGLSASTIAFHLREVRGRLDATTTREAIRLARERGLL